MTFEVKLYNIKKKKKTSSIVPQSKKENKNSTKIMSVYNQLIIYKIHNNLPLDFEFVRNCVLPSGILLRNPNTSVCPWAL